MPGTTAPNVRTWLTRTEVGALLAATVATIGLVSVAAIARDGAAATSADRKSVV
jgi:hypothetical protein